MSGNHRASALISTALMTLVTSAAAADGGAASPGPAASQREYSPPVRDPA